MPFITTYGSGMLGVLPAFEADRRAGQQAKSEGYSALAHGAGQAMNSLAGAYYQREAADAAAKRQDSLDSRHQERQMVVNDQEAKNRLEQARMTGEYAQQRAELGAQSREKIAAQGSETKIKLQSMKDKGTEDLRASNRSTFLNLADDFAQNHPELANTPEFSLFQGGAEIGDPKAFTQGATLLQRRLLSQDAEQGRNRRADQSNATQLQRINKTAPPNQTSQERYWSTMPDQLLDEVSRRTQPNAKTRGLLDPNKWELEPTQDAIRAMVEKSRRAGAQRVQEESQQQQPAAAPQQDQTSRNLFAAYSMMKEGDPQRAVVYQMGVSKRNQEVAEIQHAAQTGGDAAAQEVANRYGLSIEDVAQWLQNQPR